MLWKDICGYKQNENTVRYFVFYGSLYFIKLYICIYLFSGIHYLGKVLNFESKTICSETFVYETWYKLLNEKDVNIR